MAKRGKAVTPNRRITTHTLTQIHTHAHRHTLSHTEIYAHTHTDRHTHHQLPLQTVVNPSMFAVIVYMATIQTLQV